MPGWSAVPWEDAALQTHLRSLTYILDFTEAIPGTRTLEDRVMPELCSERLHLPSCVCYKMPEVFCYGLGLSCSLSFM